MKIRLKSVPALLIWCLLGLAMFCPDYAQATSYAISGLVKDIGGNPLSGVSVTIKDANLVPYAAVTDSSGAYTVNPLASGDYTTTDVVKTGYALFSVPSVPISLTVDSPTAVADTLYMQMSYVKGDFNNDGNPDVLLRATSNGQFWVWFWVGSHPQYAVSTGSTLAAADYEIAGVADFNNDNNPDVLLRDTGTGALWVWFWVGSHPQYAVSTGSTLAAADYEIVRR